MKNSTLRNTVSTAVQALGRIDQKMMYTFSTSECAFLLDTLPLTMSGLRHELAARLKRKVNRRWITNGDIREVFALLAALWLYDPKCISGPQLSAAIQRLVSAEIATGGPYYSRGVVSGDANLTIAIFLQRAAQPLPAVQALLAEIPHQTRQTEFTEAYLLYLLGQASPSPALREYTLQQQKSWQSALYHAVQLAILPHTIAPAQARTIASGICAQQGDDGLWDGEPLLRGGSTIGARFTATALIVQTLDRLQQPASQRLLHQKQQKIIRLAKRCFRTYHDPLRKIILTGIDNINAADKNGEIALLPRFFANALRAPDTQADIYCDNLCVANICCWLAYTIYDDFLDEGGEPGQLPAANGAIRASLGILAQISHQHPAIATYTTNIFTRMDEANTWEIRHCRFTVRDNIITIRELPQYGNRATLAHRSFAHTLGPMILLLSSNHQHSQVLSIEAAFKHYLIARQLNDDLHDWQKDVRAGHISFVVAIILHDTGIAAGDHALHTLIPAMQHQFTQTSMTKICQCILRHIRSSRQAFARSEALHAENTIYTLLDTIESSVKAAQDLRAKSQSILEDAEKFAQ